MTPADTLRLAQMNKADQMKLLESMNGFDLRWYDNLFLHWAHTGQLEPDGDWRTWLMIAGRGFGKTRAGAEWIDHLARRRGAKLRIALVAATIAEARSVMIEGESGLLAVAKGYPKPRFEADRERVVWPHGSQAFLYSGTRLGRQELDGELIEDVEGALWPRELIEACRVRDLPETVRVVIGVDPPAGSGPGSDACGIVVVGLGADGRGYVLGDASVRGERPDGWSRAVAAAYRRFGADKVIAEKNQGGEMVETVLRAAEAALPVVLVHASRGKVARAEPVAALYAAGRVSHVGAFPELEDEMAGLTTGGAYKGPGGSPDRADALVWALSELMLGKARGEVQVRVL